MTGYDAIVACRHNGLARGAAAEAGLRTLCLESKLTLANGLHGGAFRRYSSDCGSCSSQPPPSCAEWPDTLPTIDLDVMSVALRGSATIRWSSTATRSSCSPTSTSARRIRQRHAA